VSVLVLREVSRRRGSGRQAVQALAQVSLEVDAGELVLLEGPSGSGKTTLLAVAAGLLSAETGEVRVDDLELVQALLAGAPGPEAERRTAELLEALSLRELAGQRPGELSGGEEQRVALARALVHRPALVLADEPTASLDGAAGAAVSRLLAEVARGCGAAILVASHDARLRRWSSRRVGLLDGRLHVEDATPWLPSSAR
jgi:putative ABC transport system ATP-binding protein